MVSINRRLAGRAAPAVVETQRRLLARERPLAVQRGTTAVLSPASYGSFGDEGMIQGSRDSILGVSGTPHLLTPGPVDPWTQMGVEGVRSIDRIIAPGRMHIGARKLRGISAAERIVVLGADSVDGAYGIRSITQRVSLLNVAVAQRRHAELANFSFRRNPSNDALATLRALDKRVRLTARDTSSQQRAANALQREVAVFPDVAAYMRPGATAAINNLELWAKATLRPLAFLVPNTHLSAFNGAGYEEVKARFGSYVAALSEGGFAVVVLAHDVRDEPGDVALSRALAKPFSSHDVAVAVPRNAQEAKGMLALGQVVVTARMHAGVAALSQGVPCVGLDYVDKFTGQFRWYGAEDFVTAWENNPDPAEVLGMAQRAAQSAGDASENLPDFINKLPSWLQ